MTDDYKERIIKWLTGNYTIGQSGTEPIFTELEQTTTTINTYIDVIQGFIQGKDGKGNDLNIGFIYGLDSNSKGVIIIVDNEFNILQVINEYNTGTDFNEWVCLNIDITNGNIYGIDKQSSQYRFILLNNFLVKQPQETNYEVKLRNSYFIALTQTPQFVEKRPSDSFYVITGLKNNKPAVATYKIEVGSTNELIEYNYSGDSNLYLLQAYNIAWSGEEYIEKIGCYYTTTDEYNYLQIKYVEFSFNGTTITKTYSIDLQETYLTPSMLDGYMSMIMTNDDTYVCYPIHWGSYNAAHSTVILKIDYTNNTYTTFYELETNTILDYTYSRGKILKINNQIYFYAFVNIDSPSDNTTAKYKIEFGTILYSSNNMPYITSKQFNDLQIYNLVMFTTAYYVFKSYNLISYNLCGSNSNVLLSVNQILNPLNYNYQDYQDINSMVPNSAWLYNNNKIIYARNLYNKVVSGNTTTSTLEVPNILLNDIDIEQQNLLGETNGTLVENTNTITKNVYEDLFINFYNTLSIQNRNTQNYIFNLSGSSRLNNSISQVMDYTTAKIGKIRINYNDNTSFIKTINPATQISQFVYKFTFNVYNPLDKNIESIDLLSQDEETSYQTIMNLNLTSGKSYKITQNVEIGE